MPGVFIYSVFFGAECDKDKHSASENTVRKGRPQKTAGLLQHLLLDYDA